MSEINSSGFPYPRQPIDRREEQRRQKQHRCTETNSATDDQDTLPKAYPEVEAIDESVIDMLDEINEVLIESDLVLAGCYNALAA